MLWESLMFKNTEPLQLIDSRNLDHFCGKSWMAKLFIEIFLHSLFLLFWSTLRSVMVRGFGCYIKPAFIFPNSCSSHCTQFLHSPFCRAEGLCQHASIKVLGVVVMVMPNGPIIAKQENRSSSVICWQNRGQDGTSECSVVHCTVHRVKRDWTKV